jgi:hypothetical protein
MASEVNWLSSAIGPFIGAMLAFGTNRYIEREKRFQEELVAANLALITLKNQYNDFLLFRKGFREDIALCAIKGTEPVWMLIRPSFLQLGDYAVDFTSIGFLLNTVEGKEVFDKLELVQIFHRDLKSLNSQMNKQG